MYATAQPFGNRKKSSLLQSQVATRSQYKTWENVIPFQMKSTSKSNDLIYLE